MKIQIHIEVTWPCIKNFGEHIKRVSTAVIAFLGKIAIRGIVLVVILSIAPHLPSHVPIDYVGELLQS